MRFLSLILILLVSGCSLGLHPKATPQTTVLGDFSVEEVQNAMRLLPRLRPEMSEGQIFQALGLGSYYQRQLHGGHAGGTSSSLGVNYYLRKDCYLNLVFDCSDPKQNILKHAELGEAQWSDVSFEQAESGQPDAPQ